MLDENDNDVAAIEQVGRVRGTVGSSITTSNIGGYDSSSARENQFSAGRGAISHKGQGGYVVSGLSESDGQRTGNGIVNLSEAKYRF